MPYEELQHTADWCLHVWAEDLPSLFVDAAWGLNMLSGMHPATGPTIQRTYEHTAQDPEDQLVSFLSELVYSAEQEKLVFFQFDIQTEGEKLIINMKGAPLVGDHKTIKAVTYHNLRIQQTANGVEVEIVFDV